MFRFLVTAAAAAASKNKITDRASALPWRRSSSLDRQFTYPSFLLSPTEAGLTEMRGWLEMEPCDWLLAKDDVSRLTGDTGGVGLLHSEWEREPEEVGVRRQGRA